jgi:hypothetical protein
MDFVWVTNDVGDITAVTAGTGISGGGTSGAVTITNSMATEIAAKGDLIAGTGSQTFDNVSVGTNGQVLTADSSTATGLAWSTVSVPTSLGYAAGKNKIINGDFGVWQRGTSFTTSTYGADRWLTVLGNTSTLTRQTFTPGTAPASPYESTFFLQMARTTSANADYLTTRLEDVRIFAGQTVTFSFYAKADSACTIETYYDQNFGSGGSSQVQSSITGTAITTSWARYSVTTTLASISGKTVGTSSYLAPTFIIPSAAGNRTIGIWGVQLEAGSVATAFQTSTGTIQGELAACQRYYARQSASGNQYTPYGIGYGSSGTTNALVTIKLPVTMRVNPTAIDYSAITFQDTGGLHTASSVTINQGGFDHVQVAIVSTGLTQNVPGALLANASTSSYLGFSAEL